MNLALPSQNTASGVLRSRISSSLAAISSSAWSQDRRRHSPSTSFSGYFSRRSPCTSSRTLAPLAQWVPWLMGDSQAGSCPTQTSSCTSAMTVQPTEQWVQTFLIALHRAPVVEDAHLLARRLRPARREAGAERGQAGAAEPRLAQEAAAVEPAAAAAAGEKSPYREARRCFAAWPSRRLMSMAVRLAVQKRLVR